MKTRNSLVSNSSSSSFVLIGTPLYTSRLENTHIGNSWAIGKQMEDSGALDLIRISDEKIMQFIKDFPDNFTLYVNCQIAFEKELPVTNISVGAVAVGGEYDHHSSSTMQILFNTYVSDKQDPEVLKVLKEKYGVI